MATSGMSSPVAAASAVSGSRFLCACRREKTDGTPVWLMRQAGRYMPEYRALREKFSMLETIRNPRLAAEITLQPVNAFDLDAAIIFCDILPPLTGTGLQLDFIRGVGPRIANPLASESDVRKLRRAPAAETMAPTLEAIALVAGELGPRGLPLIGFAGAPFTLACYAIQGGSSKTFERARKFMYCHPGAWAELMSLLVDLTVDWLTEQARYGAAALQVFDSWAGVLSPDDYCRFVQPWNTRLFSEARSSGVPLIHFSTGTSGILDQVAASGGDVIGVDWRLRLGDAWKAAGSGRAIQGNLDPAVLLAPWPEVQLQADAVLREAAGRPGHIFNLGHGVFPETPVESVRRLVDYVHERTV